MSRSSRARVSRIDRMSFANRPLGATVADKGLGVGLR